MQSVNMLQARSNLFKLVESIVNGSEDEVIIARNGRPVAKLVALDDAVLGKRIGVAKGRFVAPVDIDASNDQVAALFIGLV
jgi:antitoxin (DNA-binding transcriptional repressor) of toxin-antitoxin stability system